MKKLSAVLLLIVLAGCSFSVDSKPTSEQTSLTECHGGNTSTLSKTSFDSGYYEVGCEIEPGTYHTENFEDKNGSRHSCYWGVYGRGTNPTKILREIPYYPFPEGKVPYTVVLSEGEDFYTLFCGVWHKVGES